MGLFDSFTKEGKLKKHARRAAEKEVLAEDRMASIRWLADEASPKAIYALLTRFDLKLNQDIQDESEKEQVYSILCGLGDATIEPLYAFLKAARQHTLPLRLLVQLRGEDAAIEAVFHLLDGERGASFEPDRKRHLLVWLADRKHAGIAEKVTPFLADFDEGVRFAAVAAILAQDDVDAARSALLPVLVDPGEESLRLKHQIVTGFSRRNWAVGDGFDSTNLPSDFVLQGDHIALS